MSRIERGLSRRRLLGGGTAAALGAATGGSLLSACGSGDGPAGATADLKFMYWGSAFEKKAIDEMLTKFEKDNASSSKTTAMYTPVSNYSTKMSSLVAAKTPPDLAYMNTAQMYDYASKDLILNLYPYLDKYPELADRLPSSYFWFGPDKIAANQLAMGVQILYYNTESFAAAGVDPVPFTADTAWNWDDFVSAADRLTIDDQGRHPSEAGFDPGKVKQFGTIAPAGGAPLYSMLQSNGASYVDETGTKYALDSAEAIEVLQRIQDLIYVHRVAPTPAQLGKNAPTTSVQLQTKRVAMIIDGNWALLDMMESKLPFGVGVLPKFQEPKTGTGGAPGAVFAQTKYPEQAIELYLYYNDPAHVALFADGLWAPLQEKYYTDQAMIDTWVIKDTYPANFQSVAVDVVLNHGVTMWDQTIKNAEKISQQLTPALDQINSGDTPAAEVVKALKAKLEPELKGRWPSQEL